MQRLRVGGPLPIASLPGNLDVPIIAVASAKGGVGKTTSALAIAAAIAMDANAPPVLLWDLDPTGDATLRLGLAIEPQRQLGMSRGPERFARFVRDRERDEELG
jgi:cellulose biosynthesis protein BcsQ